ncbi:MAG TPA: hypothetical protein VHG28_12085 [Longimicrobiaceae bacterium]|nr:hypothetical protein [Longimicrobiaceae bacterium]
MAVELWLHFTGLILYAPDLSPPDLGDPCLYAILIKHGSGVEEHFAKLVYDSVHDEPTGGEPGHLRCREMRNRILRVKGFGQPIDPEQGFGHPDIPGKLPEQVVDLHTIAGVPPLKREFVRPRQDSNDPVVSALVRVESGQFGTYLHGARWKIPGKPSTISPRRITTLVRWIVRDEQGDRITLRLANLRSATGQPEETLTLYPREIEGKQVVEATVYNSTCRDLPPPDPRQDPRPGEEADHFHGFYEPFKPHTGPTPVLDQTIRITPFDVTSDCECKEPRPADSPGASGLGHLITAHTDTCLGVQAQLEAGG